MLVPPVHESHTFLNFANGTYQWVDLQRFTLAGVTDPADPAILAALIACDEFGSDYATGPGADALRHGPYWRDAIAPGSYEPVTAAAAEQLLRGWAEQHAPLEDPMRAALDENVYEPLRKAAAVYALRELPEDAHHDWAGVHGEFHEFVAITPAGLLLIVAADD